MKTFRGAIAGYPSRWPPVMVNARVLAQGISILELGDYGRRRGRMRQMPLCPQMNIGVASTAGTRRLAGALRTTRPLNVLLNGWNRYQQRYSTDLGFNVAIHCSMVSQHRRINQGT